MHTYSGKRLRMQAAGGTLFFGVPFGEDGGGVRGGGGTIVLDESPRPSDS